MVCKCSLVERLDLLPMAVLLMIGGKLPARRAKSAHFVGHLPAIGVAIEIGLLERARKKRNDEESRTQATSPTTPRRSSDGRRPRACTDGWVDDTATGRGSS